MMTPPAMLTATLGPTSPSRRETAAAAQLLVPAVEHSVPADLYTLNYRRAFREFTERGQAQPVRLVDGQRLSS